MLIVFLVRRINVQESITGNVTDPFISLATPVLDCSLGIKVDASVRHLRKHVSPGVITRHPARLQFHRFFSRAFHCRCRPRPTCPLHHYRYCTTEVSVLQYTILLIFRKFCSTILAWRKPPKNRRTRVAGRQRQEWPGARSTSSAAPRRNGKHCKTWAWRLYAADSFGAASRIPRRG